MKEVSEALEDVVAFKRLEHSEDNIEIARPTTAYAGDWLCTKASCVAVLSP